MDKCICRVCGKEILNAKPTQLYCSEACARKAHRKGAYAIQDKGKRTLSRLDRLAVYLSYDLSCACCGFTIGTARNQLAAALEFFAGGGVANELPDDLVEGFKKDLKGANGGCEIHHIKPIAEGGDNGRDNLILLCPNCHKKAHAGIIRKEELEAKSVVLSDDYLRIETAMILSPKEF